MGNLTHTDWGRQIQIPSAFVASNNLTKIAASIDDAWLGNPALKAFESMNKNLEHMLNGALTSALSYSNTAKTVERALEGSIVGGSLSSSMTAASLAHNINWKPLLSDAWPKAIGDFSNLSHQVISIYEATQPIIHLQKSFDMFASVSRYFESLRAVPKIIERQAVRLGTNVALGAFDFQVSQAVGLIVEEGSFPFEEWNVVRPAFNIFGFGELDALALWSQESPKALGGPH